jgi:DNA polymerase-3 subunit delta
VKLRGGEVARFCAQPPKNIAGALIYGEEPGLVAARRDALLAALLGANAREEMRLTAVAAADARSDPAAIDAALRAQGFFPGPRAVVVSDATDGLAATLTAALDAAAPDAFLLVTAGVLPARSALRKAFEAAKAAVAAPCFRDPPTMADLRVRLQQVGVENIANHALDDLLNAVSDLDPALIDGLLAKLALYKLGDATELDSADIAACAPPRGTAALDGLLDAVSAGNPTATLGALAMLDAQGVSAVEIAIAGGRHFRQLHALVAGSGGAAAAARLGPPSRRDRLSAQAHRWGAPRLESALAAIHEADAALRRGGERPAAAIIARVLLRLALSADRGSA